MPDIQLKRLRDLRRRAERLRSTLVSDLKPFVHAIENNGFRRKPDSESIKEDVNITTSCSCLMGLTLYRKVSEFYGKNYKKRISDIFTSLLNGPWMSSGLPEDNAFTTTLMIRLYGFLIEGIPGLHLSSLEKEWESRVEYKNSESFVAFARKLVQGDSDFAKFLFQLFSETLQNEVRSFVESAQNPERVQKHIVDEIARLIRGAYFYDPGRFSSFTPSKAASDLIQKGALDSYHLAQLNRLLFHEFFAEQVKPLKSRPLTEIALEMISDVGNTVRLGQLVTRFRIYDYPPSAALVYWFVDGVDRAGVCFDQPDWDRLCRFASEEFSTQRSRVVARHAAMMDPVAMAMSACLCARLRKMSEAARGGMNETHRSHLPSIVELERSVVDLFNEQTTSGIWPKYFPLFHYQDAGSNFCFTFEMLEAVLAEFGGKRNELLSEEAIISGLEKAVIWCETNRLRCSEKGTDGKLVPYEGWNSGGNLETLRRGQPESWATAVVHMFLWELIEVLSRRIQQRLLDRYGARKPAKDWRSVDQLLDINLFLDGDHTGLKCVLRSTIVKTFTSFSGDNAERLRRRPVKNAPLSALLFGPPGTSKTEVAKALAQELNWPLVEIDPSHFLQDGFSNIYAQAERIFEDVMDLSGIVVLFDEMDALVQKRDADTALDTESRFLTTYMLPKLAKLHDRGQLVFLMATNFQASFDDAIKRAGRFDFLLCMGPPTLEAKCSSIHTFFKLDKETDETRKAGEMMLKCAKANPWLRDQLSLYTYGEFLAMLPQIGVAADIGKNMEGHDCEWFNDLIRRNSQNVGLKVDDLERLKEIKVGLFKRLTWDSLEDLDSAELTDQSIKAAGVDLKNPTVKYILDRRQSRRQFFRLPTDDEGGE